MELPSPTGLNIEFLKKPEPLMQTVINNLEMLLLRCPILLLCIWAGMIRERENESIKKKTQWKQNHDISGWKPFARLALQMCSLSFYSYVLRFSECSSFEVSCMVLFLKRLSQLFANATPGHGSFLKRSPLSIGDIEFKQLCNLQRNDWIFVLKRTTPGVLDPGE